jgi:hypothetical protein
MKNFRTCVALAALMIAGSAGATKDVDIDFYPKQVLRRLVTAQKDTEFRVEVLEGMVRHLEEKLAAQ